MDEIDLTLRRVRDSDPSRELRLPDMVLRRGDGLAAANAPNSSASRCACSNGRACTADPVAVLVLGASAGWTVGGWEKSLNSELMDFRIKAMKTNLPKSIPEGSRGHRRASNISSAHFEADR